MTRGVLVAVVCVAALLPACRSIPNAALSPFADAECLDGTYRGRFEPAAEGEPTRRLRVEARSCLDGSVLLEVRGAVGGPVLVAAVREDRLRLLLPRERRAVEGPAASRALWERETGLPFDGLLLRALLERSSGGLRTRIGAWDVRLDRDGDGRLPAALTATHERGMRLELERRTERTATAAPRWPTIPEGFERHEYGP